jgi:hypothetical protein
MLRLRGGVIPGRGQSPRARNPEVLLVVMDCGSAGMTSRSGGLHGPRRATMLCAGAGVPGTAVPANRLRWRRQC